MIEVEIQVVSVSSGPIPVVEIRCEDGSEIKFPTYGAHAERWRSWLGKSVVMDVDPDDFVSRGREKGTEP